MSHHGVDLERPVDRDVIAVTDDDDDDDAESCYSQFYSTRGGSYDESSFGFDVVSCASSDCCSAREDEDENENENRRGNEVVVNLGSKLERDCRICHLGLESNSFESGPPIQLGCACKDDLGSAHKNCAEAWFKIKGNKTCEICQSIARNVVGVSEIELTELANESSSITMAAISASIPASESRSFWRGHRFLNFLLACMVFAFVVSWLFHFNVSS